MSNCVPVKGVWHQRFQDGHEFLEPPADSLQHCGTRTV